MTKARFTLGILSSFFAIFAAVAFIFGNDYYITALILCISCLLVVYMLRSMEVRNFKRIGMFLSVECDPEKYAQAYEKFKQRTIRNDYVKLLDKIHVMTLTLTDETLDPVKEELMKLAALEQSFDPVLKCLYYNAWIQIYFETKEFERAKVLLEQVEELLAEVSQEIRAVFERNHLFDNLRYQVLTNTYLDQVEATYNDMLKENLGKPNLLGVLYQLGIIAYKKNNFDLATKRFSTVVANGNKLYITTKAKKHIQEIELIVRTNQLDEIQ